MYTVEIDGVVREIRAESLAEVANKIRGEGRHVRVWSPMRILLIDTNYGDAYCVVKQ